jgi:hydroxylation protein CepL
MDLGDPGLYADDARYEMWQRLVVEDSTVFSEPGWSPSGFWSVFSHRACQEMLAPGAPFTSEYGMLIGFDASHPDRGGGKMIVASDGERHLRLRRVLGRFLTPSALQRLRAFIDAEVARLLDAAGGDRADGTASGDGVVDVAAEIGPTLPAAVVCEFLGVPQEDRDYLIGLTDAAFASPDSDSADMANADAHADIFFYFHDRVSDCQGNLGTNLISALLTSGYLDVDEVLANCYNLLIGGNQTSRHLVCGVFHAAAEVPDLLDLVRDNPNSHPTVVEELARWVSPGMHVLRVATEDVVLNGQPIQKGEAAVAWVAAANRDTRVFAEPEVFRWDRNPNPHLAFGHGVHHCLGARLARMEISRLFGALAARTRRVTAAGPPVRTRSNLIQGYRSLPVFVEWAPRAAGVAT